MVAMKYDRNWTDDEKAEYMRRKYANMAAALTLHPLPEADDDAPPIDQDELPPQSSDAGPSDRTDDSDRDR